MRVRFVNDEMRLKYRAAERLGLTDKLLQVGWGRAQRAGDRPHRRPGVRHEKAQRKGRVMYTAFAAVYDRDARCGL